MSTVRLVGRSRRSPLTGCLARGGLIQRRRGPPKQPVIKSLGEVAVDGGLEVDDRAETFGVPLVRVAKKVSTAFSQEQEVGVKWKVQRGCRSS